MKCPNNDDGTMRTVRLGGAEAEVCTVCHGLWFEKRDLEDLRDHLEDRAWFDVTLWERRELIEARPSALACPKCGAHLRSVVWKEESLTADVCHRCGGMWLPKGEYQKASRYLKDSADEEIIAGFGAVIVHELERVISGEKGFEEELKDLPALLRFFEYRFAAKHPLLTEAIEELPFTK